MKLKPLVLALLPLLYLAVASLLLGEDAPVEPGLLKAEFIYETASFPQCHASTIAETKAGLVAAWFGGTYEKHPDVGIWLSRHDGTSWSPPVEVANGVQSESLRHPCWNPVLHQSSKGPLLLFYKVGPSHSTWWGMMMQSEDSGRNWSKPVKLPGNIAGPIKNKPVEMGNGRLLCGSSTEDKGWRLHMEWTDDLGKTWFRTEALNDGTSSHAIQPTILSHGSGKFQILCRPRGSGKIVESWSEDDGTTWSKLADTKLPNPSSGLDAVTLKDGRHLLVYNHTARGRSPINVAVSADGKVWQAALVLESEPGEYSYPAVMQAADGKVHITYTWKRKTVKHVVVDPAKLVLREMSGGEWPK